MDKNDLLNLYNLELDTLLQKSAKLMSDNIEFCSLVNARNGKCSQDCKYCAQSSYYRTDIDSFPLIDAVTAKNAAIDAKKHKASRFAIVTSGKTPEESDFDKMLDMIKEINKIDGLRSCASIGILNEEQAKKLAHSGLKRFHHNINTCKSYYPEICSTHTYEDKKQIQPSVFFNRLAVINPDKTQKIEREKENILFSNTEYKETEADTSTKVIQDGEILKLNASSIRNFQNCPRRYYLANLLNLKDKQTFSASYGTAVHTVMQVFFEKYLKQFNKNTLLNIAEAYFHCDSAPQNAFNAGFSQKDMDTLLTSDTLSIAEMHENFISAVDELEKKGFFNDVPDSAIAETAFYFKTEKIPDVEFDGRIDVITQKDGKFSLYDYKTGMQNKETLSHYVSENGVSFRTKTGKGNPEILKKEYPYQVPLYYIASLYSKNLEQIKGKLEYLGLKYIRPVINGGCVDDIIPAQSLEEYSDKILRNLKTEVADKIRETVEFKPEPDNFTCKNCPYEFLCDGGGDD